MKLSNTKAGEDHRGHQTVTRSDPESREHLIKFRAGLEQFNDGRFFDAHETWEEIWLRSPEPEKTFLQRIIQISAAFHHYGRGNLQGTRSLIEQGLRRLAHFPDTHRGIELAQLRDAGRQWVAALLAGQDPGPAKVPRIRTAQRD